MAELIAQSPCRDLLPVTHGTVTLSEVDPGNITSLSPFKGKAATLSDALNSAYGLRFPAPGRSTGKEGARCLWTGRHQAFLQGPEPVDSLKASAALTDQSDAWTVVSLEGADAEDVLARLVPIDLRAGVFKRGHTARTLCQHMTASITRTGANRFQIMVFRSMAATLCHELGEAMHMVAARAGRP